MARLTVDELTTPLTRAEVQASIYEVLTALGVNTTAWKAGGVVRTMIVATSAIFAAYSQLMANIARSGFLATASLEWLTLVAWYVYGIERRAATYASGVVVLENGGGGIYSVDPSDLIVRNADTGHTYRNIEAFTINPGDTIEVGIVATEPGTASNADALDITDMVSTLLGVTCSNPVGLFATDTESDTELRQRCTEMLGALSPMGPWDAYFVALRNATREADGSNLGVTRVNIEVDGYGHVDCYAATKTGALPAEDLPTAQLAVEQYAEPLAVTARVYSAVPLVVNITYSVWMYNTTGATEQEIKDAITASLTTFIQAQPVGGNVIDDATTGYIYLDRVRGAIAATYPEIFHVVITSPLTDIVMSVQQVATVGVMTAALIKQVPPPEAFHS
jgi:phage-related baseplate assembly protein